MKRIVMFIVGVATLIGVIVFNSLRQQMREADASYRESMTATMHPSLSIALVEYNRDCGFYPPDKEGSGLGSSETLYHYLAGNRVESPAPVLRDQLRRLRAGTKAYYDFKS